MFGFLFFFSFFTLPVDILILQVHVKHGKDFKKSLGVFRFFASKMKDTAVKCRSLLLLTSDSSGEGLEMKEMGGVE